MGKLAPSVEKPVPRFRIGFLVALMLVVAVALVTLLLRVRDRQPEHASQQGAWNELKPHCTPLEVDVTIRDRKPAPTLRAVCFAVAGKVDRAREVLLSMSSADRATAVRVLFAAAHPIADAGDDKSAGPIMHLVVELWPENYMAVFHAGMADFALGNDEQAKAMLTQFLGMYATEDIWRDRANSALIGIEVHQPLTERQAHFAE